MRSSQAGILFVLLFRLATSVGWGAAAPRPGGGTSVPIEVVRSTLFDFKTFSARISQEGELEEIQAGGLSLLKRWGLHGVVIRSEAAGFAGVRLFQARHDTARNEMLSCAHSADTLILTRKGKLGCAEIPAIIEYDCELRIKVSGRIDAHYVLHYPRGDLSWDYPCVVLLYTPIEACVGQAYSISRQGRPDVSGTVLRKFDKQKRVSFNGAKALSFGTPLGPIRLVAGTGTRFSGQDTRAYGSSSKGSIRVDVRPDLQEGWVRGKQVPAKTKHDIRFSVQLPVSRGALPDFQAMLAQQPPGQRVNPRFNFGLERNRFLSDFRLDPTSFDIYAGLPDVTARLDRIHLSGWWHLRKIRNTMSTPTWDEETARWSGGEELRENDIGLKEKFFGFDYDDSEWPRQFVPWDWNRTFPPELGGRYTFGGVGWYRRRFTLPARAADMRVRLHFEYVESDSTVWVNGRQVGTSSTFERHPGGNRCRGNSVEAHDYDITPFVRFGQRNVLVVRVFDNGLWRYKRGSHGRDETGGIWQAAWLDFVPPVFAERLLVTPRVVENRVTIDCPLRNTLGASAKVNLRVVVSPWQSFRYSPSENPLPAEARVEGVAVGSKPRVVRLEVALSDPVPWGIDRPFLYHVQLFAAIPGWRDGREVLIGQARFGFREFKARGDQFYLNDTRMFLAGVQINEPYRGNVLLAHNHDDWIIRWYQRYREANIIFNRYHSGHYPEAFYDLADEVGFLICEERLFPPVDDATTTAPGMRAAVERLIHKSYNHPSIILLSLGNEHLSTGPGRDSALERFGFCSTMFDLYKSFDSTRPVTACSGSNCIIWLGREGCDSWPKSDYHDIHDYAGGLNGWWLDLEETIPRWRDYYRRVSGGVDKPLINGECMAFVYLYDRHFDALRATLPKLDRKVYVDAITSGDKSRFGWRRFGQHFISNVGIRAYLNRDTGRAARARMHRRVIELFRRFGDIQVGFNLHYLGDLFSGAREFEPRPEYLALQQACAPVLVCANAFERNVFAGQSLKAELFAINNSLRDIDGAQLTAEIISQDGKAVASLHKALGSLAQGSRAVVSCDMPLPKSAATGHYELRLRLADASGKTLSENECGVHVLNRSRPAERIAVRGRVVLHDTAEASTGTTGEILRTVGVAFVRFSDTPELDHDDVLVIGANSVDALIRTRAAEIRNWLEQGGRIVCFEQTEARTYPFLTELQIVSAGTARFVDLIVPEHPVFNGLTQDDWQIWNGGNRELVTRYVAPMSECVLATAGRQRGAGFGMAVGEVRVGGGLCLFSQVLASRRFGKDSVATQYVQNVLRYALGPEWTGKHAGAVRVEKRLRIQPPKKGSCKSIDLRNHCNMAFIDETEGDGKGGWTDQGPTHDLRIAPLGAETFGGVPFQVIEPDKNKGRSCIVLKGKHGPAFPARVDGIQVGRYVRRMFFLVASAWSSVSQDKEAARFVMHYEAGGQGVLREVSAPLIVGKHMADWAKLREDLPEGVVAWSGTHPLWKRPVGFYLVEWKNPIPSEKIVSMDFVSAGGAIPICIAMTVEEAKP